MALLQVELPLSLDVLLRDGALDPLLNGLLRRQLPRLNHSTKGGVLLLLVGLVVQIRCEAAFDLFAHGGRLGELVLLLAASGSSLMIELSWMVLGLEVAARLNQVQIGC